MRDLVHRHNISGGGREKLRLLAERSVALEISGTAVSNTESAMRLHIADGLSGLNISAIRSARRLVDIGSGVGFPGLVLAVARPDLVVVLVDSVRKKVETSAALARGLELSNVEAIWARAEDISAAGGPLRESFDVVTARAVAPLAVLIEYAAPLLKVRGTLVAWKGVIEREESDNAMVAADVLGFQVLPPIPANPYPGSRNHQFFVATKVALTPSAFPRRPGLATRKPITSG